jgi:hypothetical protein
MINIIYESQKRDEATLTAYSRFVETGADPNPGVTMKSAFGKARNKHIYMLILQCV